MTVLAPLRMVSRILYAIHDHGLVGLPGVGQFHDTLVGGVRDLGEAM
jgi:hypothetical protein